MMLEDTDKDRRYQREVSQIDKEKLVYQREMAKTINAATQRYRRRLGKFVGWKTDDNQSEHTRETTPPNRLAPLARPGRWSKPTGHYHKQAAEAMTSKSTAIASMDPLLKRDYRRRGLVGPSTYMAHRQALSTQTSGVYGALNKLRFRNLTVREAGEGLPRRQYGPYEGFAALSLVHPTTHLVLQNSQKFRRAMIQEEEEAKRKEGETYKTEKARTPESRTPTPKGEGRSKTKGRSLSLDLGVVIPEPIDVENGLRRKSVHDSFLARMVEEVEK